MMEKNYPDTFNEDNKKKKIARKKLVRTTIGLLALGAVGTGIYYSVKLNKENNFKRVTAESGEYDLEGAISYDNLKKYSVIEVETIIGENKLFIVKNTLAKIGDMPYTATDLFTGKDILEGNYTSVVAEYPIEDYLAAYDLIKDKYSKEDIEELLEKIKMDYESVKEKTLVKE